MAERVRPYRLKWSAHGDGSLGWATTYATLESARKAASRLPFGVKFIIQKQATRYGKPILVEAGSIAVVPVGKIGTGP